jgi:hypothetical protein
LTLLVVIDYVQRNRNKKVIYRSFVTNSYNNITPGSSFNALVISGIVHPTAVLICPFIGAVSGSGFGDFQWKSLFDTCPSTMSPLSLTNLQVAIGDQNVLNSTLNMTCENFFTTNKFSGTINIIGFWSFNWSNFTRILGDQQMVFCKCRTW